VPEGEFEKCYFRVDIFGGNPGRQSQRKGGVKKKSGEIHCSITLKGEVLISKGGTGGRGQGGVMGSSKRRGKVENGTFYGKSLVFKEWGEKNATSV